MATAAVVVLFAAALALLLRIGLPVPLPHRVLEKALAARLPLARPLRPAGELRVTAVRLASGGAGERLSVDVDLSLSALPGLGPLDGSLLVSGVLRWDATPASLFVDGTRVERLSVTGLPDLVARLVADGASALVRELLEGRPVWRLEARTRPLGVARALVSDVAVRRGAVVLRLGGRAGTFGGLVRALGPGGRAGAA